LSSVSKHVLDRRRVERVLAGRPDAANLPASTISLREAAWIATDAINRANHPEELPDPRELVVALEHYICEASPPRTIGSEVVMPMPPAVHDGPLGRRKVCFYRWHVESRTRGFRVFHGLAHILLGDKGNETDAVLVTCALASPLDLLEEVGAAYVAVKQLHAPEWVAPAFDRALTRAEPSSSRRNY
jgi:hypothetical protein